MKEQLRVEHPEVNIAQLNEIVANQLMPVQRSPHIGNQNAAELCLQAYMPPGITVIAVDTVRGSDNYSSPRTLMVGAGVSVPLAAVKASGRVVGSIVVRDDIAAHASDEIISLFNLEPGKPIMDVHQESLQHLDVANMPIPMMDYFMTQPDILRAVMTAAGETNIITRQVAAGGKIMPATTQATDSVFGVTDGGPKTEGVMIPLNGMMAADIVMQIADGADSSLHLGGPDMIRYTRDSERMTEVSSLVSRTLSLLEATADEHCLKVADMTGFGKHLDPERHISQHTMLIPDGIDILEAITTSRRKVMA